MANDEKPKDANESEGGSAASRAGQFLEGPITQACSPEKMGYRCATQTPGCEPTGFTGECTQQPEVGGGWPCITALPFCAEPTGFTGQCTQQPWPNPTRYVGCTVLHCPTHDLTHQPQICRVVEEGLRGSGPQAEGGANADAAARPGVTTLLGCGYTQTWGLCQTHLLGCGFTKNWGPQCPPQTNIPGCGYTQHWGQCQPSVQNPCITRTEMPNCQGQVGMAAAAQPTYPNGDCTFFGCVPQTNIPGCGYTLRCQPSVQNVCIPQTETPGCGAEPLAAARGGGQTAATVCTQYGHQCLSAVDACPTRLCGGGGGGGGQTAATVCTQYGHMCQSAVDACPTRLCGGGAQAAAAPQQTVATTCTQYGPGCQTYPNGDCTFFGCGPGGGGGGGQTAATVCTQYGHQCQSAVDACPTRLCQQPAAGAAAAAPIGGWTGFGCPRPTIWTLIGFQCPTRHLGCTFYHHQCPTQQFECTMFCVTQRLCWP